MIITHPGGSTVGSELLDAQQQFQIPWDLDQGDLSLLSIDDLTQRPLDSRAKALQEFSGNVPGFEDEETDDGDSDDFDQGNM